MQRQDLLVLPLLFYKEKGLSDIHFGIINSGKMYFVKFLLSCKTGQFCIYI